MVHILCWCPKREEIIGRGIGLVRCRSGVVGMLQLSWVELKEKREPKSMALLQLENHQYRKEKEK